MIQLIGIRREDKHVWEKRVPLVPEDVAKLMKRGVRVQIQPSEIRCFSDQDYVRAGAEIKEDLKDCQLLMGMKEMPSDFIQPHKPHLFLSNTVKAQPHNMPLLRTILEKKATLLDYERIVNEENRRLLAFGRFAGLTGTIDTLSIFGKRLAARGIANPFEKLFPSSHYKGFGNAREALFSIGWELKQQGLPAGMSSLILGITGKGNVSLGAQEILRLLELENIDPADLGKENSPKIGYVVLEEKHFVRPKDPAMGFIREDYYQKPHKYESYLNEYLPYFTVLLNAIYWDMRYPRLVTNDGLKLLFSQEKPPCLEVIGDLSCDIEGAIECTVKSTNPGNPAFVFDPLQKKFTDGWQGFGVAILAVDTLPCEFSLESSTDFSQQLFPLLTEMIQADFTSDFSQCTLPPAIQRSVIVWQGKLTSAYEYLIPWLEKS